MDPLTWAYDFAPCSLAHAFERGAAVSRCGEVPLRQVDPLGYCSARPLETYCRACDAPPRLGWLPALLLWSFRVAHAVRRLLRDRRTDDRAP